MKKLFAVMLILCLVLCSATAIAETYSAKATVVKTSEKEAVLVLNGLEYRVQKGKLKERDVVSLTMWDMNTSSKLDDVVMFAMSGIHVVHVEMMGGVAPSRTAAAK